MVDDDADKKPMPLSSGAKNLNSLRCSQKLRACMFHEPSIRPEELPQVTGLGLMDKATSATPHVASQRMNFRRLSRLGML